MFTIPMSKGKADAIANGVFLIILGILLYANQWWPWILLALCANLGLRQYLTNRKFDMFVSIAIFGTMFIIAYFNITLAVLMPILFMVGGAYLILREYFYYDGESADRK